MSEPDHYAEAFSPQPGRCFRLVSKSETEGQPIHCPEPPVWHGMHVARDGRRYRVEACQQHRGGLVDAERIGSV
jgi:hypothetical protein